jgi:hypothetical protein
MMDAFIMSIQLILVGFVLHMVGGVYVAMLLARNFAQAGGRCIKHGYKKPTYSVDGCSNQSVARGLCKRHGAHRSCNVINCRSHVFRQNMCQFYYSLTNVTSRVTNKSITVFTTTNFITKSGTVTTNLFTATTEYSTVTEIDIVIQQVMEFVGMGNWEQVHTLLCANFGDIHRYLICIILGKFQWMVERNVD